ncbi:MAG: tetratricopeptide repeat protein [Candidatus Hodarchaeales archaeon]
MENSSPIIAAIKNYLHNIKEVQVLGIKNLAEEAGYPVETTIRCIENLLIEYKGLEGELDSEKSTLTVSKNTVYCDCDSGTYDRETTSSYNCSYCGKTSCAWCLGTRLFMNQFICPSCFKKMKVDKICWKDEHPGPQQDFIHALDAFMEQRYSVAIRILERIQFDRISTSNQFGVALALACCYEKINDTDKSQEWLEKAKLLSPNSSMLYLAIGNHYEKMDKDDSALDNYLEAIRLEPENPVVHAVLGNYYEFSEKKEKALAAYHKAIEIDPENAAYWITLGDFHDLAGEDDLAEKSYIRATELEENNPEIWKILGFFYEVRDRVKEATNCYQKYYSLVPRDYASEKRVTGYFRISNEIIEAKREYQQALSLDDPQKWNELARSYKSRENYDKAIHFYEKSLKRNPDQIKVLKEIATLYNVTHQISRAEELFSRIEKMEGISDNILDDKNNRISGLLRETLDYVVASRKYETNGGMINQKMPWEEVQVVKTVEADHGEYKQLIDYFEKMLLFNPDDRMTLKKLALIYKKTGNRVKYEEYLRRILSLAPYIDIEKEWE